MTPRPWTGAERPALLVADAAPVVWSVDLDAVPIEVAAEGLPPDERRRAAAFRRAVDRRRYTASRLALRRILAAYAGRRPDALAFETRPGGKPVLPGGPAFSLSHAGPHLLVAVHARDAVGVDVEAVAPVEDGVLARVLTARERAALDAAADRDAAFARIWTLKEAILKTAGEGLARPMPEVEIDLDADPPALRAAPPSYPAPGRWRLRAWADGPVAGALAWVPGAGEDWGTPGDRA